MIELLSLPDAVEAIAAALRSTATGVFNIAGADRLPFVARDRKEPWRDIPIDPGPLLGPLYRLRQRIPRVRFRLPPQRRARLHVAGLLDETRARTELHYIAWHYATWPRTGWRALFERLGEATIEASPSKPLATARFLSTGCGDLSAPPPSMPWPTGFRAEAAADYSTRANRSHVAESSDTNDDESGYAALGGSRTAWRWCPGDGRRERAR